jgi:hypothetical protein
MDGVWKKITAALAAETTQINSKILIAVFFANKWVPSD